MSQASAAETHKTIKELLKPPNPFIESADANRLDSLRRTFAKLIATHQLSLTGKKADTETGEKWNAWLKKQHQTFVEQLSGVVKMGRKSGLRTFLGIIASSPIKEGNIERINDALLMKLLESLVDSYGNEGDGVLPEYMLELLEAEFCKYRDVQYFTLMGIRKLATQLEETNAEVEESLTGIRAENLIRILMKIDIVTSQDDLTPLDVKKDGTCSNFLFLPPAVEDMNIGSKDHGEDEGVSESDNDNDSSSDEESEDDEPRSKKSRVTELSLMTQSAKRKYSSWQAVRQHRNALQQATLAVLKIPNIPIRTMKKVLQIIPTNILPKVTNPLRFSDFCTRAYDMGGMTSLLALHSLFILMTQHGLEYPKFYPSLYALIDSKTFYAKHRTRFFKLLVKCLTGSQMLPAYLIAAFCKKLCRCALNTPPSGALFVLALVSNLLRKHPECACLIHRQAKEMEDTYKVTESDPAHSGAIDSSLWELNALERHYHPAVSSMAKACGIEDENTVLHDLDTFLLHTYKSLFDQERKSLTNWNNKRKKTPLAFKEPKSLFVQDDIFYGLYSFGGE